MTHLQPSYREAVEMAANVERSIAGAVEVEPQPWSYDDQRGVRRLKADGVWLRYKGYRYGWVLRWPVSDITARCHDCNCILRARRDAGCTGFSYDRRLLEVDVSKRGLPQTYTPWATVCLPCFNRVRPRIREAKAINETRLLINRIKRELRHAA